MNLICLLLDFLFNTIKKMKKYTVIKLNEHIDSKRCFDSDKLMPCIEFIHKELDNSKLSWNDLFKENPICIIDSENMLVVWSIKLHIVKK